MKRYKQHLMLAGILAVLGIAGAMMSSHPVSAQPGSAPVTIVNPLPVPVTGSTTVSGSVGITGQPIGVNVNNSPTVGLAAGTTVLVKNVDEPGRAPYQESVSANPTSCGSPCEVTLNFSAVPNGKRLVIREVSAFFSVLNGGSVEINLDGTGNAKFGELTLPLFQVSNPGGNDLWVSTQPVTLYVDAGQQPTVRLVVDPGHFSAGAGQAATLTGYFVNLP